MSKTTGAAASLLLGLLLSLPLACRRAEPPARGGAATERPADELERAEVERPARGEAAERLARQPNQERDEDGVAGESEDDDSEEAKEAAEELRMRQRALQQLQEYRAKSCTEAIARITELLRTQKGRWLERDERGQMPGDLVRTLTQAELWGTQSESVCKDDPARSHLDDLRNLMTAIWQYPRTVPRDFLEQRLRLLG